MSTPPAQDQIGFIGLGLMGHGIAKNIVEKGFALTFLGRSDRAKAEDMLDRGAAEANTPAAVAAAASVVFLCVTGSRQVEEIVRGPGGLKEGLKPGSVVVDCSTSDPTSTAALAAELQPLGVDFADAPLSRTPKEAWEGTLDTMVGATDAVFQRIKPVLETWAGRIVHIGGPGDGHRMKLLNNFVSLGYAALYAEALALADKVGISPARFDSVIRNGRMDCPLLPDLHAMDAPRRSRGTQVQPRQCLQGSRLPGIDGRFGRARQSARQHGEEQLRRRRVRRASRPLCADAGHACRSCQRGRPDAGGRRRVAAPRGRDGPQRSLTAAELQVRALRSLTSGCRYRPYPWCIRRGR